MQEFLSRMAYRLWTSISLLLVWTSLVQAEPWVQVFRADDLRQGLKNGGTTTLTTYGDEKVLEANLTTQRGSTDFAEALMSAVTPGKYRATYRLSIEHPPVGTRHDVRLLVVQHGLTDGTGTRASVPLRWANFPVDASPLDIPVEFTLNETDSKGRANRLRIILAWSNHGDLNVIRHHGLKLERIHEGLVIEELRADKLIYRPGDAGVARVRVRNFSTQEQSGTLDFSLTRELADTTALPSVPVTLTDSAMQTIEIPFTLGSAEFGYQLRAVLRNSSGEIDSTEDVFGVANDWWKVAIGAPGSLVPPAQIGHANSEAIARALEGVRASYANWLEMFFWAPDDWGDLTPQREWWYSGQTGYYQRRDSIKELIRQAHVLGIKTISYGKGVAGGPEGWELARRHPDWFKTNHQGQLLGSHDTYALDNWNNEELRRSGTFRPKWQRLFPDFAKREPLDWGIDQIILSAKEYGWDGVRFDGHFGVQNHDMLSAHNMHRLKERIWKDLPYFVLGFNYGWHPDVQPGGVDNLEVREAMAGGGHWLAEGIKSWHYSRTLTYKSWQHYVQNELNAAKQVQGLGGSYHVIYGLGNAASQDLYKLIYGLISGGHLVYGSHVETAGCANWGKFMTRWSAFLWDLSLQRVVQPEQRVNVHTTAPVVWKPLVQERVESANRKFLVVHLVNPSPNDEIAKTVLPAPVTDILVIFKGDRSDRVRRVMLVQPEAEPYSTELQPTTTSGLTTVVVSRLNYWAMVIFELDGEFNVPPLAPRFASPSEPTQSGPVMQRDTAPVMSDPPAHQGEATQEPNEWLWETDSGFWNIQAEAVADPEGTGGMAQRRDRRQPQALMGRTWVGPFAPGRYRVSYRVKWVDQEPYHRQRVEFYVTDTASHANDLARASFVTPNDSGDKRPKLGAPNVYQYYPFDIELKNAGLVHVLMRAGTEDAGNQMLYLDHIKIEQLEPYPDTKLAEWSQLAKPSGLRRPAGAAPQSVLQVKGLYWQLYGIQEAVPRVTSTYHLPTTHEELYAYDVVVLCNVDLTLSSYATRQLFKDFVEDGGRLVILGGPFSLGQGGIQQTYLDDMLPLILKGFFDVVHNQPPLFLGPEAGSAYPDHPALFWRHDVTLRSDAKPLAYAGSQPIAARRAVGHGQVIVFAGTVLGEDAPQMRPFWLSQSWATLVKIMVME